jgi:ribonuclease HI
MWDFYAVPDKRGLEVEDWITDKNLRLLNTGDPTRVGTAKCKSTRNKPASSDSPLPPSNAPPNSEADTRMTEATTKVLSSPDITLCGRNWNSKTSWYASDKDAMGNSDHTPIIIDVYTSVNHNPIYYGQAKWKFKNVNWSNFSQELENNIPSLDTDNIEEHWKALDKLMTDAGNKHVGRVKVGKHTKTWMNPHVRSIIKRRNRLRKKLNTHRDEWREAWKDAQSAIKQAKEDSWKDTLDSVISDSDSTKIWKVINSLNETPAMSSPNEVMVVGDKRYTDDKSKANQFVKHYASVSSLEFSKEDKESVNKKLKSTLNNPSNKQPHVQLFTPRELSRAIKKMKIKGAPGPDDIPPSFLKNLGPKAFSFLLNIFNLSISQAVCPQQWRDAIIIPLLKSGKPASKLDSYRPISLTSCVVKTMERMIGERLYQYAESKGLFSDLQAGFRKGMSCEDQILTITQAIDDGFKDSKRSVAVMLDFSKAFDTVWREKLLLSMIEQGVPMYIVQWISAFLLNRQAKARYNGSLSDSRVFKQGLPQGSVLAPLLFLFYINNLAVKLENMDTVNTLFADDVTVLGQDATKEGAARKAQESVDVVNEWSKAWKLLLNATKSEVGFFSKDPSETYHSPTIIIDNVKLRQNPNEAPRLLGVLLDRTLSFTAHTNAVIARVRSKQKILAVLGNSDWGWDKVTLRRIYIAHCRSSMDYAAIAYQPFLLRSNNSNAHNLDKAQNSCLRTITRQAKTSPLDAIRLESGVPSYFATMNFNCIKGYEKSWHLPSSHPRTKALTSSTCLDAQVPAAPVRPVNQAQQRSRKRQATSCNNRSTQPLTDTSPAVTRSRANLPRSTDSSDSERSSSPDFQPSSEEDHLLPSEDEDQDALQDKKKNYRKGSSNRKKKKRVASIYHDRNPITARMEEAASEPLAYNPRSILKKIATHILPDLHPRSNQDVPLEPRQIFTPYPCELWYADTANTEVHCDLPGISSLNVCNQCKQSEKCPPCKQKISTAAYRRIRELGGDNVPVIYTDGSATGGCSMGGHAAVITLETAQNPNPPDKPNVIDTRRAKGARLTCSYGEEEAALDLALSWTEENPQYAAVLIVTDSQSLCKGLSSNNPDLEPLQKKMRSLPNKITLQWVPGHFGIAGNELADRAAKEATRLNGPDKPLTFRAVRARVREATRDPPCKHDRVNLTYKHINPEREREIKQKSDQVLLAKVRTGHSTLYRKYIADHIEPSSGIDTTCPRCKTGQDDLEHWMTKCDHNLDLRREFFGPEQMDDLGVLTEFPAKALRLIKKTLPYDKPWRSVLCPDSSHPQQS